MPRRNKIALIGAGNIGGELAALVRAPASSATSCCSTSPRRRASPRARRSTSSRTAPSSATTPASPAPRTGTTAPAPTSSSSPPACRASRACRATTCCRINLKIIRNVAENLKKHCPDAFVIVISNPLDAMVYELKQVTGFPAQARWSAWPACSTPARFQLFLAREAGVVGQGRARDGARRPRRHMVPVLSYCTINGIPVTQLIADDKLEAIVERTRNGGGEIVKLMGTSALLRAGARRRSRWPRPTSTTRSACSPAPRTSTASTATRTSTWACRS